MKTAATISKCVCFLALLAAIVMAGEPAPGSSLTISQQVIGFFACVIVFVAAAGAAKVFDALHEYRRDEPIEPYMHRRQRRRITW